MMGEEAPETCWATHKRQIINMWNCCILLVNLFESYDDAQTYEHQSNIDIDIDILATSAFTLKSVQDQIMMLLKRGPFLK